MLLRQYNTNYCVALSVELTLWGRFETTIIGQWRMGGIHHISKQKHMKKMYQRSEELHIKLMHMSRSFQIEKVISP